jgi:hypothetical protein
MKEKPEAGRVTHLELRASLPGWLPLMILPTLAFLIRSQIPAWGFMWTLSFAIFAGCKWLTWWPNRNAPAPMWRHCGYLFAWPGLDAKAFLAEGADLATPTWTHWMAAFIKTIIGAVLTWGVAKVVPNSHLLLRGWIGLAGLVFILHFGTFHLLALAWQRIGVNAQPIMRSPIRSKSLAEFWGKRWNAAFHRLVYDLVFHPARRHLGVIPTTLLVFLVSGLVHDLVISLPARETYGLPTIYFLLQGIGLLFERSATGKILHLRRGMAGFAGLNNGFCLSNSGCYLAFISVQTSS